MSHAANQIAVDQLVAVTAQNQMLYDLVLQVLDVVEARYGLSSEFTAARAKADALAKEVPKGPQPGSPDFTPIAELCDAEAAWHLQDALKQSFLHVARRRLAAEFPALVSLEVEFEVDFNEIYSPATQEFLLNYVVATFDGGHYISFASGQKVSSRPLALVLRSSSADNSDEQQGRAQDAAFLRCAPTIEAMQQRIDLISVYLDHYFSHVAPTEGLDTVYERAA